MTRHVRGDAICAHPFEVRLADAEETVLSIVEYPPFAWKSSRHRSTKALAAREAPKPSMNRVAEMHDEVARVDAKVVRLAHAIAAGGELTAIQERSAAASTFAGHRGARGVEGARRGRR